MPALDWNKPETETVLSVWKGSIVNLVNPEYLSKHYGASVTDASHIAGYDDAFTHGFSLPMVTFIRLKAGLQNRDTKSVQDAKTSFALTAFNQPFVKEAWEKLKKEQPFETSSERKIAAVIDLVFDDEDLEKARSRINHLSAKHPWNTDDAAFADILCSLMQTFVRLAESPKYKKAKLVPDDLKGIIDEFIAGKNLILAIDILTVEWRNQFLARNIAELYCKALAEGKDLHVIIGKLHLQKGLKELLSKMSNGQITPVERDFEDEMISVIRKLQSTKKQPR